MDVFHAIHIRVSVRSLMPCSVTEQQLEQILHAGQARKKPLGELVYYDTDRQEGETMKSFEYVIIGSGQGGTPLGTARFTDPKTLEVSTADSVEKGKGKVEIERQTIIIDPQLGRIGLSEKEANKAGLPYTALRDGIFAHPTLAESLNTLFAQVS